MIFPFLVGLFLATLLKIINFIAKITETLYFKNECRYQQVRTDRFTSKA